MPLHTLGHIRSNLDEKVVFLVPIQNVECLSLKLFQAMRTVK